MHLPTSEDGVYNQALMTDSPLLWESGPNIQKSQRSSPGLDDWAVPPQLITSTSSSPLEYSPRLEDLSPTGIPDFTDATEMPEYPPGSRPSRKPVGPRPTKVTSDRASRNCAPTGTSEGPDESLRLLELDNSARDHPLYQNVSTHADGLYHCPWENDDPSCQHKPEKLKCNYDKFVDSHLKPYRCKVVSCEASRFSSTACLLRHEREAHAMHGHGDKPYLCSYDSCDRSVAGNGFPRHWNLRDHMRRVHNDPGQSRSSNSGSLYQFSYENNENFFTYPVNTAPPTPYTPIGDDNNDSFDAASSTSYNSTGDDNNADFFVANTAGSTLYDYKGKDNTLGPFIGHSNTTSSIPCNSLWSPGTSYQPNEMAYTDSGYASIPKIDNSSNVQAFVDKGEVTSPDAPGKTGDDTGTVYSAATTIMPNFARQSISDICKDIYNRLEPHVNDKNRELLCSTISDLIKALAIKLGLGASDKFNRGIMHFVHKHRQEIARQLHLTFHEHEGNRDAAEGMSLLEKMSMWGRGHGIDEQNVDKSDFFEGVKDEDVDEDYVDDLELSAYSKAIIDSRAYEWFIASLLKGSSLHWNGVQPRIMTQEIRQKILKTLPTGTISKNRAPITYKVTFHLPWRPLKSSLGKKNNECPILPGQPVSEYRVLTCSSGDQGQITTARQYLDQIWPLGGKELLSVLQEAFDGTSSESKASISPDRTELGAIVDELGIAIWVSGCPYSIAERGEQLAWLVAALQHSNHDTVVNSTPVVTAYRSDRHHWTIESDHKSLDVIPTLSILQTLQRHDTSHLLPSIIVQGFPTKSRPDHCPGVEVTSEILLDLVQPPYVKITNGRVLLQGRHVTLVLVNLFKESTQVLFWHVLRPDQVCFCRPHNRTPHSVNSKTQILDKSGPQPKKTDEMYKLQPDQPASLPQLVVVGDQSSGKISLLERLANVSTSREPGISAGFTSINPIELTYYRHILGECNSTRASLESDRLPGESVSEDEVLRDHMVRLKNPSVSGDSPPETSGPASSGSTILSDSQTVSLDSDLLSMSDTSEDMTIRPLDCEDALFPIVSTVACRLLRECRQGGITKKVEPIYATVVNNSPSNDRYPSQSNGTSRASSNSFRVSEGSNQPSQRLCHKRKHSGKDDDAEGDESRRPQSKKGRPDNYLGRSSKLLACPFWKRDPGKHRGCFRMKLDKISRVKQHLHRNHTPDFYCEHCLLISLDKESHETHIESRRCSYKSCEFNGILHAQRHKLSKKSDPNLTESDQWFSIWEILFPEQPRPASCYMDPDLSEDLCQFLEYTQHLGPAMLAEAIQANVPTATSEMLSEETDSILQSVISLGLNALLDEWLSRRTSSAQSVTSGNPSSSSGEGNRRTPASSFADSGVVMETPTPPGEPRQAVYPPRAYHRQQGVVESQLVQTQGGLTTMENAHGLSQNSGPNPTSHSNEPIPQETWGSGENIDESIPFFSQNTEQDPTSTSGEPIPEAIWSSVENMDAILASNDLNYDTDEFMRCLGWDSEGKSSDSNTVEY